MQSRWAGMALGAVVWTLAATGMARADDTDAAPPQTAAALNDSIHDLAERYRLLLRGADETCVADLKATGVEDLNNPQARERDPDYRLLSAGVVRARSVLAECKARAHKYLDQERADLANLVAGQAQADQVLAHYDADMGRRAPMLDRVYDADARLVDQIGEIATFLRAHGVRWSKAAHMFAFRSKADLTAFNALAAKARTLSEALADARNELLAAAKAAQQTQP
ncbi:hypothetical protein [Phenylobacterium montanum]|uniref:Uncharacterized protein n=1 Tax=Phenylobacterium montanum TaxID=2823693 RepID=A0A975FXV8_9CAUL|nr:hypothetical protein [Caulobacter sp. S6]QUD86306.1 hypothetical protein KCG34_14490 [Caulobacter sp. S6]